MQFLKGFVKYTPLLCVIYPPSNSLRRSTFVLFYQVLKLYKIQISR